jgi:hypothetical protein
MLCPKPEPQATRQKQDRASAQDQTVTFLGPFPIGIEPVMSMPLALATMLQAHFMSVLRTDTPSAGSAYQTNGV